MGVYNLTSSCLHPGAKRLAERLGGLPLALATAGAYLHRSSITFERYLEEYERRWNINPRRPTQLQEYRDRTLYTTWDLSYERLQGEDTGAAKLLGLLAYFDHQSVWYNLVHAGLRESSARWMQEVIADDIIFDGVMGILADYCFVEAQTAAQSWSIHLCVHDWTLAALNAEINPEQYWYAFDCVARSLDVDDRDQFAYTSYNRLAAHAVRLVHERFQRNNVTCEIGYERLEDAECIARLLGQQIQLASAEQMYFRALAGKEKALGGYHTSTLNTVHHFGGLHCDQGKLDEAEQMYLRALAGKETSLGRDHASTLHTVNNLGSLYYKQGKLDNAEQMYLRALAGYKQALEGDHTSMLNTVNNLGLLYNDRGKLDEAEQIYTQALTGYERALGCDHTLTINAVNNLGLLYYNQGKLDEAEQMYARALAGYENALGGGHTSTLNTVNNLGLLYYNQGKLKEAEQMYARALAGYENALGEDHTLTLNTVNNLGNLYRDQGKLKEAEQMYVRALAGYKNGLGEDHTSTLATFNNLGNVYSDQSKLGEAGQMYIRALAGYEKALGRGHASTLDTVGNLGLLYHAQGKLEEAERMYLRALDGKEKALGRDHISTLRTVNNLGSLYRKCDRPIDVIELVLAWGGNSIGLYGDLGRLLLLISDDKNAQRAFQHQYTYHNVSMAYAMCDGCGDDITAANGRAVCRRCSDVDLCQECFRRHEDNYRTIESCVGHGFFEVVVPTRSDGEQGSATEDSLGMSWLYNLAAR